MAGARDERRLVRVGSTAWVKEAADAAVMRPLFHNPSMMSSFAHPPHGSRREIAYEPPASTHARGAPPQWPKRTDAHLLCPSSPPPRAVLPHLPRAPLGTRAAARLPDPQSVVEGKRGDLG